MEPRRNGGTLAVAILLIGIGLFFLLVNTNVVRVSIGQLWPAIPALIGAALLVQFFTGGMRDPGLVTGGTIFLLTGLFFFLFTLGVTIEPFGRVNWGDMAVLWPAMPTIIGVALLIQWLVGGLRDHGLLIPVTIFFLIGLGGFAFTLRGIPAFSILIDYWPALLIVIGLIVLVRSLRRPQSSQ